MKRQFPDFLPICRETSPYCTHQQTKVYLHQQDPSHLSQKCPRGDIAILESLVGEGRLRAVRFFGNLAAVGTLFYLIVVYNKNGGTVCPPN